MTVRNPAPRGHKHKASNLLEDTLTAGDVLYVDATGALTLLPIGSTGNVLSITGGVPVWAAGGGGAIQLSDLTDVNTSTPTNKNFLVADGVDWESRAISSDDLTDVASIAMLDENEIVAGNWTFDQELQLTPGSAPAHNEGLLWYDSTDKALVYYNDEAEIELHLAEDSVFRCRNTTGSTISKGKAVYISGATGANLPNISLAQADALATSRVAGIAMHDIENNSNGYVLTQGIIEGLDTSSFTAGDVLFLSTSTAGALTNTRPTTGYAIVVGYCTISNVSVGEIKVALGETAQRSDLTSASQSETISGSWEFSASPTLANAVYLRSDILAGTPIRMLGINAGNVAYVGPIDAGPTTSIFNASSTSTNAQIYASGSVRGNFSSSGLAVTGLISATSTITGTAARGTDGSTTTEINYAGVYANRVSSYVRNTYTGINSSLIFQMDATDAGSAFRWYDSAFATLMSLGVTTGNLSVTGDITTTGGSFNGDGSGLTFIPAASISPGSFATGVLYYTSAVTTASDFAVPFLNTTGVASGNFASYIDSGGGFTYNPSTNTLVAGTFSGAFSGSGAALTSIPETAITDGSILARLAANETVTGTWTFTPRPVLTAGFETPDSNMYIWNLTGASTWGMYWNTTNNALELHAAGSANIIFDIDSSSAYFGGDISMGNLLNDRIAVYGSLDAATSYGIGIEASTLYFKSNSIYRWYVGQNADGGVAHKMALTGSLLNVLVNADFASGIDVTGNITVTGTVDGVDIAALDSAVTKHADTETITGQWNFTTVPHINGLDVGLNSMPVVAISASQSFTAAQAGYYMHKSSGVAITLTCDNDSSIEQGATWVVLNNDTEDLTIAQGTGVTVVWIQAGASPTSGNVTVTQGGIVTVYKLSDTIYHVWGAKEANSGLNNLVEDTTPQLGGTLDANGNIIDMGTYTITDAKVGQWDTAYGWGNHASAGYLSNVVEDTTPQLGGNLDMNGKYITSTNHGRVGMTLWGSASTTAADWSNEPNGTHQMVRNTVTTAAGAPVNNYGYFTKVSQRDSSGGWGGLWVGYAAGENYVGRTATSASFATWEKLWTDTDFSSTNVSNWNTAYGWGNHASAGYLTSSSSLNPANISSGNLGSGVLPYATASATASAFKVPFLNTTGVASGNFGLLHDSAATFTYNPSTDTLTAGTFSGSGSGLTLIPATSISPGSLATGVLPYTSAVATASAFAVPFMNTTGVASGNFATQIDSGGGFTYNPSTNTLVAGTFSGAHSGSGASLTSLTAANISAGSLASGVNSYFAANASNTHFKIPFINYNSTASVNAAMLHDSGATFTYNPSTNEFTTEIHRIPERGTTAPTATAGYGYLWVQTQTPNYLMFTDDAGTSKYVGMGQYTLIANQTFDMNTAGNAEKCPNGAWYSDNATAYTLTLENSTGTDFPVGSQMTIWNEGSGTLTITEGTSTTLYLLTGSAVTDTAGGCTMAQGGYATLIRKSATVYLIMGAGITP